MTAISQREMSQVEIDAMLGDLDALSPEQLELELSSGITTVEKAAEYQDTLNSCNNIGVLSEHSNVQLYRKRLNSLHDLVIVNKIPIKVAKGTAKYYRYCTVTPFWGKYLITVKPCGVATYAKYEHPKYTNISIDCRVGSEM